MPTTPTPDEHTGNVRFPKPPKKPATPNHIDTTFVGYGGEPRAVDNWQAIALTAIDVFAKALRSGK